MKILVLGSKGQLGLCVTDQLVKTNHKVVYTSRSEIDISDFGDTRKKIESINPDIVINLTAYTSVDKAENEKIKAELINHLAVANIANTCEKVGCWLIHISTDYVFDGRASYPYSEVDRTNPKSVYGRSKLDGELAIQSSGCKYLILRTAWIFSEYGKNFVKTMLRLGAQHDTLKIVGDQFGCPTYGPDIAKSIVRSLCVLDTKQTKLVYHYAGYPACSWSQFAKVIFDEAYNSNKFLKKPTIVSVTSEEYLTLAERPLNSMLDSSKFSADFGCKASVWIDGVRSVINSPIL